MNASNLVTILNATALVTMMLSMGLQVSFGELLASARPPRRLVLGLLANYRAGAGGHARIAARLPGRPDGLGWVSSSSPSAPAPGRAADHRHRQGRCPWAVGMM